jgi:hypothetical protein
MRKLSLISAILLLASAWMLAQNSTPPTSSAPSSAQSAAQDTQQAATQTAKEASGNVEGCVGGSAGSYTLTDSSGKTYQLAGDTSSLADHVGHQVKVTGTTASAAAAGGTPTITVKKVKMVSATCPNK